MIDQSFKVFPRFSKQGSQLRKFFEKQFENPHHNHPQRFVWDYWVVGDQYRHFRTPAYHYFPKDLYMNFHQSLVEWGRSNLGCHDISPPWLSMYVEGHFQNWHADVPHGPWAFVYSLTPSQRKFSGGRTRIMKPRLLNYWQGFQEAEGYESSSFFDFIEPEFNQLLVFDARYPHSVEEVRNVFKPEEGRLVIHGWFVEPRPYVIGPLTTSVINKKLKPWLAELSEWMEQSGGDPRGSLHGTLTLALKIRKSGEVASVKVKTNTLLALGEAHLVSPTQQDVLSFCLSNLKKVLFPAAKAESELIIPLIFK